MYKIAGKKVHLGKPIDLVGKVTPKPQIPRKASAPFQLPPLVKKGTWIAHELVRRNAVLDELVHYMSSSPAYSEQPNSFTALLELLREPKMRVKELSVIPCGGNLVRVIYHAYNLKFRIRFSVTYSKLETRQRLSMGVKKRIRSVKSTAKNRYVFAKINKMGETKKDNPKIRTLNYIVCKKCGTKVPRETLSRHLQRHKDKQKKPRFQPCIDYMRP